jgi:hypothetical protein
MGKIYKEEEEEQKKDLLISRSRYGKLRNYNYMVNV